jgi:fatty-acyl-CoA synthase
MSGNCTRMRIPDTVVAALLDHQLSKPDAVFYTALHAGRPPESITYRDLCQAGACFTAFCTVQGIECGSNILLVLPHSGDLIRALSGAIYAGVIPSVLAVPSFKLNHEVYHHEILALTQRIEPAAILTTPEFHAELRETLEGVDCMVVTWAHVASAAVSDPSPPQVSPDSILLLQHSSGSTGLKKGVALSHRAVLSQVEDYAGSLGIGPEDRIVSWLPLYHDMGLIAATLLPLVLGIPVVGLSPFDWVARPVQLLRAIMEYQATLCWLPNFAYNFMGRRIRETELEGLDLSSMRAFINCSEPVIAESHRLFARRFGPFGVRPSALHTCYALAENTFAATQSRPEGPTIAQVDREVFLLQQLALPGDGSAASLELMSSGVPLERCEIRILDEQRRPLSERQIGEIALRSPYLFDGYFGLPEETERVLVEGWYLTGDLGYLAEGELFVTGRKKDLIIIGGRNYYPQDIERIISEDEEVIDGRVVALGCLDQTLGTEALIVLAESHQTDASAQQQTCQRLRQLLASRLDCVASDIRLVPHMWLLKTSSGKIARRPNLDRYLQLLRSG